MAAGAVVVAVVVLFSGQVAMAASKAEKMRTNFALARLSMIDAIRITESQTGGKVFKAELKRDDDRIYYELEFVLGDDTVKTKVDAVIVGQPEGVRLAPPAAPPAAVQPRPLPPPPRQPARPAPQAPPPPAPRPAPRAPAEEPAPRPEPTQPDNMMPTLPPSQEASPALPPSGIVIPFDTEPAGGLPAGFTAAETNGVDKPATWRITADDTAPSRPNVVTVTENTNDPSTFNLLVANQPIMVDVDTTARVNVTSGAEGTGAGLIWRYQDASNYYVASYNKAENTLDVWRVKDGKRKRLGTGVAETEAGSSPWHEIRVEMKGDRLTAHLDGKKMVSERDFTFAEAGRVGFWVSGDTTASFDDLTLADPGLSPTGQR